MILLLRNRVFYRYHYCYCYYVFKTPNSFSLSNNTETYFSEKSTIVRLKIRDSVRYRFQFLLKF